MDRSTNQLPLQESLAKHNGENGNFFVRTIDRKLNALTEKRIGQYTERFARQPDGSMNEKLAGQIRLELERRNSMGKELDMWEPIRWLGLQATLTVGGALGIKQWGGPKFTKPALSVLLVTTGISSVIQAVRFYPRFDAGLKGGAQVALSMYDLDQERDTSANYRPGHMSGSWTASVASKKPLSESAVQR